MEDQQTKLVSKISRQRNEIARLTMALRDEKAAKIDHVFRLRKILAGALDDHPMWKERAMMELGR